MLKAQLLPALAHGQELAAFALEEPTGGAHFGVSAEAVAAGEDHWRLFGTKYLEAVAHGPSTSG